MTIGMEVVASSMLRAIGYDAETQTVSVQFKNGDIWHYTEVPQDVYDYVRLAPSVGSAFVQYIRDTFPSERQT